MFNQSCFPIHFIPEKNYWSSASQPYCNDWSTWMTVQINLRDCHKEKIVAIRNQDLKSRLKAKFSQWGKLSIVCRLESVDSLPTDKFSSHRSIKCSKNYVYRFNLYVIFIYLLHIRVEWHNMNIYILFINKYSLTHADWSCWRHDRRVACGGRIRNTITP